MNKIILISFVLIVLVLSTNAQNNLLSIGNNKIDNETRVPIYLNNSVNIGSFQIRLDYDPASVSVYSDPIMDKGDLTDFYAPDNSHNKSGYIIISAMKFGSGGVSGNLTIGYVRLHAIEGSGSSIKLIPTILAMTDDSGKDIIERNVTNATTYEKREFIVQSAYSMNQSDKDVANSTIEQKIGISEPDSEILTEPVPTNMGSNPPQTILKPETKFINSGFSGIVVFTVFIICFIIKNKFKKGGIKNG